MIEIDHISYLIIFFSQICEPAHESDNILNFSLRALCRSGALGSYERRPRSQVAQCFLIFVTKVFVSEISKDQTTQGREEGRLVRVSNDCCCEDSEREWGADYSTDLCDELERRRVKMLGANYFMRCGGSYK